jgi:copper chaperone CopZ
MTATVLIQRGLVVLSILLAISCSQGPTENAASLEREPVKISYVADIANGGDAQIMIEGMSCERMCVNAVSKSIAAVPSVTIQEMRFDAEKTIDTLIVSFDSKKVTEQQLIEAIESVAGGDTYHVKEVQLSKDVKTSDRGQQERSWKGPKVAVDTYRFEVPNFFDILRKVSI